MRARLARQLVPIFGTPEGTLDFILGNPEVISVLKSSMSELVEAI
jgi:hypothetical protein